MTPADTSAVRRPLAEASHAPGALYASPEFYRLDVERLFMRDWLYAGRVEELARPGDYLTMRIAGEPIAIARNPAGELASLLQHVRAPGRARSPRAAATRARSSARTTAGSTTSPAA